MNKQNNESLIQNNTISLLQDMGWRYISPDDIGRYRKDSKVLLDEILYRQLESINSFLYRGKSNKFSSSSIKQAIRDINADISQGLMLANNEISDLLMFGNSYKENVSGRSENLFYMDFENIDNNDFSFTEEYVVDRINQQEIEKTRRPDLVLFINGIPVVVVELKATYVSTSQGISQMIRNQGSSEIPELFKYVQLTLAANNSDPRCATVGSSKEYYNNWEEEDERYDCVKQNIVKGRETSELDKTVYSLFKQR